jgi:tetraacyldisaccharide 4'-kinase
MDPDASLRLHLSRALEGGKWQGPVARVLSRAWGEIAERALARPLTWPAPLRVVAVGGATLGGSGKTPLAIACARELAERGARVALVGHGYRARLHAPRVVRIDDDLQEVGDEALACARALAGVAPVVVGPSRQSAVERAAELAEVVVIDGALQTRPERAHLSLLALDGPSPWGAGEVVPRGDLRASRRALLEASDLTVILGGDLIRSRGAFRAARLVSWSDLSRMRVGLFLALARPTRVLASLAQRGIVPSRVAQIPDHGGSPPGAIRSRIEASSGAVDLWLASAKCALHLEAAGVPHATLEHVVLPSAALLRALDRITPRSAPRSAAAYLAP